MNILLIILIIIQSVFLYKQNMDSTLLKNELSSLKLELLSTKLEVQKMAVSLENNANLAPQSNTVNEIIISEPSLFTYQNGLLVLSVIVVCALTMYSLQSVDNLTETVIKSHNTQINYLDGITKHSMDALETSTLRLIIKQAETKTEILDHMDSLVNNTTLVRLPFDAASAAVQNTAIGSIVDIAAASV